MSLVVIGANATVARAAATLEQDLIHVQLPGSPHVEECAATSFLFDYRERAPFLAFVDEVLAPLSPAAIVSLTELGLEPAAAAAERLGTAGTALSVVRAMRNKLTMRRLLAERAPQLNVAFAAADDPTAVERLFAGHSPVVVKPVAGSGSAEVALVHQVSELPASRRTADTIVEQFVGGVEFSVEALSCRGRHTVIGIAEKGTTTGFVEVSHVMPPHSLDESRRELIERAVCQLLDALGLTDGPSHSEFKINGDRVAVIETHNRLGGDGIADLVKLTRGIDWRRCALGWAVGAGVQRELVTAPAAATVFFTAPPGRVTAIAERPALKHGLIVDWQVTAELGDEVALLRSSSDRLGWATLTAADPSACAKAVAELTGMRIVTTEPIV